MTRADMVGAIVALDSWMELDHETRMVEAHTRCERLCDALAGVPGLQVRFFMISHILWE